MADIITCTGCGRDVRPLGPLRTCPYCGAKLALPFNPNPNSSPNSDPGPAYGGAPAHADVPSLDLEPVAPTAKITPPPVTPDMPVFPERMKANKALAGRTCAGCANPIDLGEDVWNCPDCRGTMHVACHDAAKGCKFSGCPSELKLVKAPARAGGKSAVGGAVAASASGEATKPCPYCGESILASAKKCRFCGEYTDPKQRKEMEKAKAAAAAADDDLTWVEILFTVLCYPIGCILSIVWIIQGKKKGGKLLLLSFIVMMLWGLLRVGTRGY
jgi:predicted RNA-binding Zn-ribbon protein involved in translation (DUF1610 family)